MLLQAVLFAGALSATASAEEPAPSPAQTTAAVRSVVPSAIPAYPFPEEYVVPQADEVGTTAGQFRARALMGGTLAAELGQRNGIGLGMQTVVEGMLTSVVGLRGTGFASIPFDSSPQILAARLGPSVHFLPYRRLDVGIFSDAGLATLDLFRANRTLYPVLGAGMTMDYALSSFFALHLEFSGQAGIADQGAARVIVLGSGLVGLGVMF